MKKSIIRTILAVLAIVVTSFGGGLLFGSVASLFYTGRTSQSPQYDVEKDGALIYSLGKGSYWVNTDFSVQMRYSKEYEPDENIYYAYVYDVENNQGYLKDECDNRIDDSSFEPVLSALDGKGRLFDGCIVIQDKDLFFMDVQIEERHWMNSLCVFDGTRIRFVSEIGIYYDVSFDEHVGRIKVLDNFVR